MKKQYIFNVRVTGVLIEKKKVLLVKQKLDERNWSLPGGRLENYENIEEGLLREMKEETGLTVKIKRFLYLTEKLEASPPLIHLTFLLERTEGEISLPTNEFDENPIFDVQFVMIKDLENYGFSKKFIELCEKNFPDSGSYKGSKKNIGL